MEVTRSATYCLLKGNSFDDACCRVCKIVENLDEVTRWRDALPSEQRRRINHPSHWQSFCAFKNGRPRQQRHEPRRDARLSASGKPIFWGTGPHPPLRDGNGEVGKRGLVQARSHWLGGRYNDGRAASGPSRSAEVRAATCRRRARPRLRSGTPSSLMLALRNKAFVLVDHANAAGLLVD